MAIKNNFKIRIRILSFSKNIQFIPNKSGIRNSDYVLFIKKHQSLGGNVIKNAVLLVSEFHVY